MYSGLSGLLHRHDEWTATYGSNRYSNSPPTYMRHRTTTPRADLDLVSSSDIGVGCCNIRFAGCGSPSKSVNMFVFHLLWTTCCWRCGPLVLFVHLMASSFLGQACSIRPLAAARRIIWIPFAAPPVVRSYFSLGGRCVGESRAEISLFSDRCSRRCFD